MRLIFKIFFTFFIILTLCSYSDEFLVEEFKSLENWDYITFPLVKKETEYSIIKNESNFYLKTKSNDSASSIQCKKEFNVYEYPFVKWRWKVDNVFKKGDVTKKGGDDYPIRVYIIFTYINEEATPIDRFKYNFVKKFYGLLLPHSSINYIWANKKQQKTLIDNPFEPEKSKIFILRYKIEELGMWQEEEINIIEDYKKAFGKNPPSMATVAIMNDSDNTGEVAISYIDYIKVFKK